MKWFWILGVLLGAGGPVRAQMDSVAIRLEKIKTATEDSVRLEYAGEIEYFIRSSAFGSYRTEKPVKYLGYKRRCRDRVVFLGRTSARRAGLL